MNTKPRWVAAPDASDALVTEKTGRSWDEWVALIDAGPGRDAGHTAIATWLRDAHGVDAWWAQGVTVGYERITGIRLPGQMPDGTFSVSRSRTLPGERDALRTRLLDDETRAVLLPDVTTMLRSAPTAKQLRFDISENGADVGILAFSVDEAKAGVKVVVTHEKLTSPEDAERWKQHWADWLARLSAV